MGPSPALEKPPIIRNLNAKRIFETLTSEEKLYAHHLSRAAWHGARIIMAQVSSESVTIYELILELYAVSQGDWKAYGNKLDVSENHVVEFLEYAATFLHNIGNYFGKGDQRFNPQIPEAEFAKLAGGSKRATELYDSISSLIYAPIPTSLGYPSENRQAQSNYYLPGEIGEHWTKDEISAVSKVLQDLGIDQENTRFLKTKINDKYAFTVHRASTEKTVQDPKVLHVFESGSLSGCKVVLSGSDHHIQLEKIIESLDSALAYVANERQRLTLEKLIESFRTGDMEAYKDSQRHWVKDIQPSVENIFGFVEPYRDPAGVKAEFEGLVGLVDKEGTKTLTKLAEESTRFIKLLPWTKGYSADNNAGKGPFEKELFEAPDFTSLYTLTYCSSIIFPGINLPNFNDIRQETGFKNVMIMNSMSPPTDASDARNSSPQETIRVDPSVEASYRKHYRATFYLWVVFHELLGHGTGKLLSESADGTCNFDKKNPPVDPITGRTVSSWYKPGETWTGLFGDIATTVDECRCECVGAYFISFPEILELFGYTDGKDCEEMEFNMFLQLGCAGLRALNNYIPESQKWGQAHSRGHFAIMRILLAAGDGFLEIKEDSETNTVVVKIDQRKIKSHGLPALGDFLLRLHMFRSTANVQGCREYYETLTTPDEQFLRWREMIVANKPPQELFVQDNTFLVDGEVVLREYDATPEGMIKSWAERAV